MVLDDIATLAGTAIEKKKAHQTFVGFCPFLLLLTEQEYRARDPLVERGCIAVELLFELRKAIPRIAETPAGLAQGQLSLIP